MTTAAEKAAIVNRLDRTTAGRLATRLDRYWPAHRQAAAILRYWTDNPREVAATRYTVDEVAAAVTVAESLPPYPRR